MSLPIPYYQDDLVTLYHGDCIELLPHLEWDALVTDPPYGIGWRLGSQRDNKFPINNGIENDQDTSARDAVLSQLGERLAVSFGSFYVCPPYDVSHIIVWQKPSNSGFFGPPIGWRRDFEAIYLIGKFPNRGRGGKSSILKSSTLKAVGFGDSHHSHEKPVDVMRILCETVGEGTILDPFAGSGSTLVAAKQMGRKAIGIELEQKYCDIIVKRLSQESLVFPE